MIWDRKSKKYIEQKGYGSKWLNFLYKTTFGSLLLKTIAIKPWFSKLVGFYYDSPLSKKKIRSFVESYGIDMALYEERKYRSFNDFFTRRIKNELRPKLDEQMDLIAPCSSKLMVYPVDNNNKLSIKGNTYTIEELLRDVELAETFRGGTCLVFRLTVDDYHRYCFVDNGFVGKSRRIKGFLHTVGPISSEHYKVYAENSREYCILHTDNFGDVIQMEIGAILVGKINNHPGVKSFKKGDEKGFFSFGGSTVVLLFKPGIIELDKDIIETTGHGLETRVCIYEKIGRRI